MSRAKPRSGPGQPGALFDFAPGAEYVTAGTVPDNPRLAPCAWCGARPGEDCTAVSRRGGRRTLTRGYHPGRGSTRPTATTATPSAAALAALARLAQLADSPQETPDV